MKWMNLEPIKQWSKSERENQILYIKAYIWNLEGWYWHICSHTSNGDADIENRLTDKGGEQEGEGEMNGESSVDACTPTFVNRQTVGICCMIQELKLGLSNNLDRWGWMECGRDIQEWGDTRTPMVHSCGCMTNQTNIVKQWLIN